MQNLSHRNIKVRKMRSISIDQKRSPRSKNRTLALKAARQAKAARYAR